MSRPAQATIRDVARHAAVSVASVSRALNGHGSVHPDMRARVQAAAKLLGYVPHAGARSLSMARTHAIGVILPDLHGEFFSEIVRGMDREATARGYHLLLSNMHADAALATVAMRSMRGRVDGLVVMAPQLDAAGLDEALPGVIPAILINSLREAARPAMRVDNRAGIAAVVGHLVASGRRRLVHIAGPTGNVDGDERRESFLETVAASVPDARPVVLPGTFREESGEAAVATLAERGLLAPGAIDGIVAANDMMALGALTALRAAGVAVPGGIAVTGFDDIPLARYLGLTTVRVDLVEMGARAVTRLVERLEGGVADDRTEGIVPELVIRTTTESPA